MPTGTPRLYELDVDLNVMSDRYLGIGEGGRSSGGDAGIGRARA